MKKILLLFATLALLLSILVSMPSVSTFAQSETETYENEEFGFTLEHPSEWKPEEPTSLETELVGGRPYVIRMELPSSLEDDVSTRTNRPMVEIDVDKSDSALLEQYVSEQIDGIVSVTPNMNIEANETTLAGLPAYAVEVTSPGGPGKGFIIFTMTDDGTVYEIHYTSHASKFDTYFPIVQKIMNSFRIIGAGAGQGGQSDIEQEDEEDENN